MPDDEQPDRPRFLIRLSEVLVVWTISMGLACLIAPAVAVARQRHRLPPSRPRLEFLKLDDPSALVLAIIVIWAAGLIAIACLPWLVPARYRRFLTWKFAPAVPSAPPPPPVLDGRPAIASLICSLAGAALVAVALLHVHADRTQRRPVITWVGPLRSVAPHLQGIGWGLTGVGIAAGGWASARTRSRWNRAASAALLLGLLTLFGSCFLWGAMLED